MLDIMTKYRSKIVIVLALVFLILYLFFSGATWFRVGPIFSMPDENVNYFFTKLYAEHGVLQYLEPLNDFAANKIHPRSFNVVGDYLVPTGFLGLILFYGALAKIFTLNILPFLTPIFSVLAAICFYFLIRKAFNQSLAFLSYLLLLILPAYAYYASKSLVPNMLFIALCLIGLTGFLSALNTHRKYLRLLLIISGSIMTGFALSVRTVEGLWLLLAFLALAIVWRQKIKWHEIVLFITIIAFVFVPIFYYHQEIYGHWWASGYASFNETGVEKIIDTAKSEVITDDGSSAARFFLLPFGVNLKNIFVNFYHYQILFSWWFFLPFVLGFIYFVIRYKKRKKSEKVYFWLFIFISVWLNIFYGSWRFFDNPDPSQYSIGTSYVRYFLPIYIMWLPFVAIGLKLVYDWLHQVNIFWGKLLFCFLLAFLISQSIWLTFYDQKESLVPLSQTVVEYKIRKDQLLKAVPPDAVILTKRAEKYLYPERKVIFYTNLDPDLKNVIKKLLEKGIGVYYYSMAGEESGETLMNKFKAQGIDFSPQREIYQKEILYKLNLNVSQSQTKKVKNCCNCH